MSIGLPQRYLCHSSLGLDRNSIFSVGGHLRIAMAVEQTWATEDDNTVSQSNIKGLDYIRKKQFIQRQINTIS